MDAKTLPIVLATNNGSIGGGEVMLLNIAEALRAIGFSVTIVAPTGSGEISQLAEESRSRGFSVSELHAESRLEWMLKLRSWDHNERKGILWCNGLVPAAATAGSPNRIVHLHQRPNGVLQQILFRLARLRSVRVLVPSENMRLAVPDSTVLANWCEDVVIERRPKVLANDKFVIGFLGRPSIDKGVNVLVDALMELDARQPGKFRLAIAGTAKFVDASSADSVEQTLQSAGAFIDRLGWVDREDLFSQIDVLAVPSIWQEPFGLVAAEAMAARVPLIVSNAGALPEVVGEDGVIVPAGKAMALADAIEQLCSETHSKENRTERMRTRWETDFSPSAGTSRVAALLDSLAI